MLELVWELEPITSPSAKSDGSIGFRRAQPETNQRQGSPLAPNLTDPTELGGELLTVCAASANESDAALRLARHPDATAEDMEGFGVAVACYFGGVRLQIIRGISNRAGDRDKRNWNIDGALHAASALTLKTLSV